MIQLLEPDFIEADDLIESLASALQTLDYGISVMEHVARLESIYARASAAIRYKIISELIDLEYTGARPLLLKALSRDTSPLVRHEAAYGLGILGKSADAKALVPVMLNDLDPMVRHEAAISLAALGGEENLKPLVATLNDKFEAVADSANYALQTLQLKLYRETEVTSA